MKTHTGTIISSMGEKRVKLHERPFTWVVSPREYYHKNTGLRGGINPGKKRRLILSSIKPINTGA